MYTSGFEDAIKTLTDWTKKEKKFDALVKDFEVCVWKLLWFLSIMIFILCSISKQYAKDLA